MARVAFTGDFGDPEHTKERDCTLDLDAAAAELRQAGYEVSILPDKYSGRVMHPLDDFIEAVIVGPNDPKVIDAIMNEVEAIVRKFGGCCYECGSIEPDHVAFVDLRASHRDAAPRYASLHQATRRTAARLAASPLDTAHRYSPHRPIASPHPGGGYSSSRMCASYW